MNKTILVFAALVFLLVAPFPVSGYTTQIQIQEADTGNLDDCYAVEDQHSTVYGTQASVKIRDYPGYHNRPYFKFNLSAIPPGATVTNATFSFNLTGDSSTDNVSLHHVFDGTWTEETLTWNNQPCGTSTTSISGNCNSTLEYELITDGSQDNKWFSLPITNMVKYEIANGNTTVGFILADLGGDTQNPDTIISKESASTKDRPYINVTYDINDSALELNAIPGWSTTQNNVIISCTYNTSFPISATLLRDGIIISNPYSATLGNGVYNFTCYINETVGYTPQRLEKDLTITAEYFQCTNETTYAFYRVLEGLVGDNVTLNFTSAVGSNHIKPDMTDIYSPRNSWVNTTSGYYFTINITGINSTTVYFGNYMANNTYSETPNSENITSVTGYSQDNSYYVLLFVDEITTAAGLPPNANTTVTMYCSLGASAFAVNDTQILIPTHDTKATSFSTKVSYASDFYLRSLLVDLATETKTFYLVDALSETVVQIPTFITDYTFYNGEIMFYRKSGATPFIITEGVFDLDRKFVAYLLKDEPYMIRITKSGVIRELGFYTPPAAETLNLEIASIGISPDLSYMAGNLLFAVENTSMTQLRVSYRDLTGQTTNLNVKIYNNTNQTAFLDTSYGAANDINITVNNLNMTADYYTVVFSVDHAVYGNSPVEFSLMAGAMTSAFGFGTIASWIYGAVGFIIMLFTSFAITPKNRFAGLILLLVAFATLMVLTWFTFAPEIIAMIIIFIAVAIIYEFKRGGMT